MSILTIAQLTQYAAKAGFAGSSLQTIVAVAMGESGGNTDAWNRSDPFGGSFGVLQINGSHITGFGGSAMPLSCAYDPQCSFNYAYQLSNKGTDFTPWGAYTNGSYRQYLSQVGTPNPLTSQVTGLPTIPTGNPFDFITQSGLWQWLSDPMRLIKMTIGIMLIGLAILLMLSPEAASAAKKAVFFL